MKTRYNKTASPALRFMAAFMLLFAFSFTACSGTLFKNLLRSLKKIEVSPGAVSIANGTTTQFIATAIFSDGTKHTLSSDIIWESSAVNIASVDSTGLVTAIQIPPAGHPPVTITATYKGLQSTATLTITSARLVALRVTPGVKSIANGTKYNFYAIGRFTDSSTQDLTTQATWSGGGSVFSLGADPGLVTAQSPGGPETITAEVTVDGITKSSTASVTVTDATLEAITTSVSEVELIEGTTYQLRATAYFSDSSTQDITTQATWSGGGSVCSVGPNTGIVTASDEGTATITATYSGKTATTVVTVTDATIQSIAVTPE